MYRSKILNRINLDCFIKFIVHELNSEMVKFGMVVLTGREKSDVTDANMIVDRKLQAAAEIVEGGRERES
jgi:hypothetical protein